MKIENSRSFQLLANTLPLLVFSVETKTKKIWYNQFWVQAVGVAPNTLEDWSSFFAPIGNLHRLIHNINIGQAADSVASIKSRLR